MRKQTLLLLLVLSTLLLPSCRGVVNRLGPVEDLVIERHGSAGVDLEATITNQTGRRVELKSASLRLCYREAEVAQAQLLRPVELPRHSTTRIESRWRLRSEDPAALNMLLQRIERGEYEKISLGGVLKVGLGGFKKSFSFEKLPLSDFLRTFEAETSNTEAYED